MPKIVFYIRALFHESIMTKVENIDAAVAVQVFNSLCNITAGEYRKGVHSIQLQNLREISPHIIVNHIDKKVMPFAHIQNKTREELSELDDTDILIPLDDDDWLSPEIKNFNFIDGLSGWNVATLRPDNWASLFYLGEHKHFLRATIATEEDRKIFDKGLLSNSQAFSGRMVKQILNTPDAHALLQRHTRCRAVALTHGFDEYITNDRLAVYVKHACNITSLAKFAEDKDRLHQEILKHKTMHENNLNLVGEYEWATKYMHKLAELNKQL